MFGSGVEKLCVELVETEHPREITKEGVFRYWHCRTWSIQLLVMVFLPTLRFQMKLRDVLIRISLRLRKEEVGQRIEKSAVGITK